MKKVLAFRIGRKYNGESNQGSVQFLGESEIGEFIDNYNLSFNEDEYYDEGGNPVGLTPEQVESGIGAIDYDGEYNTVYTKEVEVDEDGIIFDELTSREHNAILWSEDWQHDEIKEELNITERA